MAAGGGEAVIEASRVGGAPATWVPADERDTFISWLRGEFAAANAIIDALCHHLQSLAASPGEYDLVLSSIQQRRYNWNPVLHMQQYYSVAEVLFSLQQVALNKKQQQQLVEEPKLDAKTKPGEEGGGGGAEDKESSGGGSDNEEQRAAGASYSNGCTRKHLAELCNGKKGTSDEEVEEGEEEENKHSLQSSPRSYTGLEEVDGQQVNVLEGLDIHENVFDTEEASRIAALVTESHAAKKKNSNKPGGNKPSSSVKPKEVIQFGTIPSDILSGDSPQPAPVFTEETAEPMPAYLESIIDHLVKSQIVPASKRPDSCSISVLEPGDYMPPHKHNNFEQPLYILALGSQSELTFGRNMKTSTGGEANATKYKVALPVGSVLILRGNSAQMVQCAVSPVQSTRLLVTFGKIAKRTLKPLPTSPVASSTSPVSPTALNVNGHSFVPASLQTPVPVIVPLRTPVVQTQVLPTQPMIVASIGPYTPVTVVSPGWSTTPPARVPSPGTGVFLPAKATSGYNSNNHHHHHHHNNNHHHHMNGSHRRHATAHHFHNATTSNGHVVAEKEVAAA